MKREKNENMPPPHTYVFFILQEVSLKKIYSMLKKEKYKDFR